MHTCVYLLRVHMTKNTYMYKIHICICKYTPGLSRCIFTRGCIFAHVQINFYIYAIAFTCPKIHPGANYTYMYNIHPVCKSAHLNGALVGRWSSAFIRRIIYKFLNVCPFDYTAFVVSGKVGIP